MKNCIIDEAVHQKILGYVERHKLGKSCASPVGLLIGQMTEERVLVVDSLPTQELTPPQEVSHGSGTPGKPAAESNSLFSIREGLLPEHAKQVSQLLCGGFYVVGIFAIAKSTADIRKSAQSVCPAWLHAITKALGKEKYATADVSMDGTKLLYMYDLQTNKFSSRIMDASDARNEARAVDVKVQSIRGTFHRLTTVFTLSYHHAVDEREGRRNVGKQLLTASLRHCLQLKDAHYTFNKQWRAGHCPLTDINSHLEEPQAAPTHPTRSGKDKKARVKKVEAVGQEFVADIFIPYAANGSGVGGGNRLRCAALVSVDGSIQAVAYVHNKATVDEAIAAICCDIRRSLSARCLILSEEESLYEHETPPSMRYEFPLRTFIRLPSGGLRDVYSYYDYYEMDESEESCGEILVAVGELFSETLTVEGFVKSEEVVAVVNATGSEHGSEVGGSTSEPASDDEHIKVAAANHIRRKRGHYLLYALGVIGAGAALAVTLWLNNGAGT